MFEKPLAPVGNEMATNRRPFLKFVSDEVDNIAGGDIELMGKLESFAWSLLAGIDGFYIDDDGKVDLISRQTGKQISCDLHAAFCLLRLRKRRFDASSKFTCVACKERSVSPVWVLQVFILKPLFKFVLGALVVVV